MDLKIARRIAGLTQQQLAERADVDHSFISLLESGKRDVESVGVAIVVRIARALNVEPYELFPTLLSHQTATKKTKTRIKRSA